MKKNLVRALKVLVAGTVLAIMFWHSDLKFQDLSALWNLEYVFKAFAITGISFLLGCLRLQILVSHHHRGFGFTEALSFSLIGLFFNTLLPGGVGGDVVKGYYIAKANPEKKYETVFALFLDRLTGLISIVLICIVALFLFSGETDKSHELVNYRKDLTWCSIALVSVILSFGIWQERMFTFLLKHPFTKKFSRPFQNLLVRAKGYRLSANIFLLAVGISLAANVLSIYFFAVTCRSLGYSEIPMWFYFFAVPVGFMASAVPITPAGIGVGQMVFFYLFLLYSKDAGKAGLLAVSALQVVTLCLSLVGGVVYLGAGKRIRAESKA